MHGMNGIGAGRNYQDFSKFGIKRKENAAGSTKVKKQENTKATGNTPELSKPAQELLDRIKEKYSDMDIFVADFSTDEEANDIMSRSTTAYSLLISPDELEKMAQDEKYADEKLGDIDKALDMGKKIDEEYGLDKALEEDGDSTVVRNFGITINSDGTMSMFAQLEQISAKQKEHIKAAREKHAKEQAEAEKKAEIEKKADVEKKAEAYKKADKMPGWLKGNNAYQQPQLFKKTTTVLANSLEELMDKIKNASFDKVKAESEKSRIDFSV